MYNSATLKIEEGIVTKKQKTLVHILNINDNYKQDINRYNYISDFIEFDDVAELNIYAKNYRINHI